MQIVILMPVFDDWQAAQKILVDLDKQLRKCLAEASVLFVDDASCQARPYPFLASPLSKIKRVEILRLRRNLGHQRAIAVGITWIYEHLACDAVVVMDADGEDKPEDVPRLLGRLAESGGHSIVFAERKRRSEGMGFGFFYRLYRIVHELLTGIPVRIGNFSAVPFRALATLVCVSELWNHYAAAVLKARLPFDMIPTSRGKRLSGKSHMNFVSLVTHGLSAISVFGDTVGVRLLVAAASSLALAVVLLLVVPVIRFGTNLAIPGWATYVSAFLLLAVLNLFMLAGIFTFWILASRNNVTFLPLRDYAYFVTTCESLDVSRT